MFNRDIVIIKHTEPVIEGGIVVRPKKMGSMTRMKASVQPTPSNEKELFGDGYRNKNIWNVYIKGEFSLDLSDKILIDGKEYTPLETPDWTQAPSLHHTKIHVQELENA